MLEVLQRWGQQRGEVRYLLRHQRAPGRESGRRHLLTTAQGSTLTAGCHGFTGGKPVRGLVPVWSEVGSGRREGG